jgi:antirestriction protein ArdC
MEHAREAGGRTSLYAAVTQKVIAELEQGRMPWVQPWEARGGGCDLPRNAGTGRAYSGINILILWHEGMERGWSSQRWLTYRQAQALGGHVRKGEQGTCVCYADRFTPKDEAERAASADEEARSFAFLKRFTVFNIAQVEGLPEALSEAPALPGPQDIVAAAEGVIWASGADLRISGDRAYYAPEPDYLRVPEPSAFTHALDWYRTLFHELGHWTGHSTRLAREQRGTFGGADYAREELVAEMASAFTCAALQIEPKARHSDYIGAWLDVLRGDERAIFRAASQASKAADLLLNKTGEGA